MTNDERSLLLTVARIMRAHITENRISRDHDEDLWALNEALKPFDPLPQHGGDSRAEGAAE